MDFERIRQLSKPLLKLEHRDTVVRLVTYVLFAAIAANGFYIVYYLVHGGGLFRTPGIIYLVVLIFHSLLLAVLRSILQAARAGEERFRKVFQVSPVAIVITTLDEGRIVDANDAYWKLSGHNPKTSIGPTTFELRKDLQPEDRTKFVRELLEKKSIQNPAYDFVNDSGEHLKTIAFYELIDVGDRPAILSMFYDMTEQDRARDALRQSEARLLAMLEAVPDMVFGSRARYGF